MSKKSEALKAAPAFAGARTARSVRRQLVDHVLGLAVRMSPGALTDLLDLRIHDLASTDQTGAAMPPT